MEHFEPSIALSHPYNDVHLESNDAKVEKAEVKEENVQTKDNNNSNDISKHYCVSESSKSSENGNNDDDDDEDNDNVHVDDDEFASSPHILSPIQAADKQEELEVEEERESGEQFVNIKEDVDLYDVTTKPAALHHQITNNNNNNNYHNNTSTEHTHTKSHEQETNVHHFGEEQEMLNEEELQTTPITRKSNDLVWDKSHLLQSLHSDNFVTPTSYNKKNYERTNSCSSNNNNKAAFPPCPLTPASKFIAQSMKTPLINEDKTHQESNIDNNNTKLAACHPYLITPTTITTNDNNKSHKSNEECRRTQQNINLVNTKSEQTSNHEEENITCNNNNDKNTRMMNEQQNYLSHEEQSIRTDCDNVTDMSNNNNNNKDNKTNLEEMAHNVRHRQRAKSYSGMTNFLYANNHINTNNLSYESMQQMYSSTPRPPRCPSSERGGPHLQRELFTFHAHQPIHESQNINSSNNNKNNTTSIITPLTKFNLSHNANLQNSNHHYYNSSTPEVNNFNSNSKVNTCTGLDNTQHVEENIIINSNSNYNISKANKEVISPSHVSLNSPMMQMAAVWVDAPVVPPSLSNTPTTTTTTTTTNNNNNNNELYFSSVMPSLQSNTLPESNMELGYSGAYRQNKRRTTPRSRSTSQPPSPMTNTLVMMNEQQHSTCYCEPNSNENNNIHSANNKVNVNTLSVQTEPVPFGQLDVSTSTNKDNNNSNIESNLQRVPPPPPSEKHLMSEIAQQQNSIIHELKAMNADLRNLHCDCGNEKKSEKQSSADNTDNIHTVQATGNINNTINNNANELQETHKDHELHFNAATNATNKSNNDDKHRNNEALFEPPSYLNTQSSPSSSHPEFQDKVEETETVSSSSSSSSVAISPHVNKAPCKTESKIDSQSTNEETMLHNKKDEGAVVEQKVNNHDHKDNTSQITLNDLMQALERARQRARYIRDKTTKKEKEEEEAEHNIIV